MNNKGFTLIELMISVSLVAVVLIFTLNLLNDLRAEEDLGTNKTADLSNRTIITKVVQSEFDNYTLRYVGKDPSNTSSFTYCGFGINYFAKNPANYSFFTRACIWYMLDDGEGDLGCRAIMIGSTTKNGPIDYFAYAKAPGFECGEANPDDWSFEKWHLSSAFYSGINVLATQHAYENNVQNNLSGDLKNYLLMIKIPTTLSDAYANTSMNFDLEFIYYTSDIGSYFVGAGEDRQIRGLNSNPLTIAPNS